MRLPIFFQITMVLARDNRIAVRLLQPLSQREALMLVGYKHVRPWRVEDEPFVWEA